MENDDFSNISITKNYYLTKKEETEYISQINQLLVSFEKLITFSLFTNSVISGRAISELMLKLMIKKEGYDFSKEGYNLGQIIDFSYQQKIIPKQCKDFLQIIRNGSVFSRDGRIPNELIYSFLNAFYYFLQWFNNDYSEKYQKIFKIDACCGLIESIEYDKTNDTLEIIKKQKTHEKKNFEDKLNKNNENKESLLKKVFFKKTTRENNHLGKTHRKSCLNCGFKNKSNAKFCTKCGSSLHPELMSIGSKSKSNKPKKYAKNKNEKNSIDSYQEKRTLEKKVVTKNVNENIILEELRIQNESLKQILETVLETNKIAKNIDEKINIIINRLDQIQSFTERLIENAWTEEEIDRIIQTHTNECVKSILEHKNDIIEEDEYDNVNRYLIETFGELSWSKLSENSKTFLITSKIMFNKLINLNGAIDYSGICILATKALEVEIFKRFFTDFIIYLDENYDKNYSEYPTALLFKNTKPLHVEKFTMGNIAFVLCPQKNRYDTYEQKENNKVKLIEYCKSNVFSRYNDEEIEETLNRYATSIEDIRIKYRNPSAHRNEIKCVDAKECIDLIIDVEKLLKQMLDSFDY